MTTMQEKRLSNLGSPSRLKQDSEGNADLGSVYGNQESSIADTQVERIEMLEKDHAVLKKTIIKMDVLISRLTKSNESLETKVNQL